MSFGFRQMFSKTNINENSYDLMLSTNNFDQCFQIVATERTETSMALC